MKAAPVFITLSLLLNATAFAKDDNEAGGPHATQALHHDEAGTVTYRGELGGRDGEIFSLKIGPAHHGQSWVAVYVGANGCLGDIAGQAAVVSDVLQLTKDDRGFACSLTIHRSATGAAIVENSCASGHGLSCSFDTQGKTLHLLPVKAPVAGEPQNRYCGIVHDYDNAYKIMDGKFNPYWDRSESMPPRDPKGLVSSPLLREGNCLCVDGSVKAYNRAGQRAYAFTDVLGVKVCDTKSVRH